MEMSKDLRFAMLLDCYGEFLTPHQYRLTELYYCADLSLSEIAEIVGITRQGVRDGIKRGEQILQEMEEKLQFAARLSALRENYSAIAGVAGAHPGTGGRCTGGAGRVPPGNGKRPPRAGAALKKDEGTAFCKALLEKGGCRRKPAEDYPSGTACHLPFQGRQYDCFSLRGGDHYGI